MKRFLFAICFLSFSLIIRAQTIRTDWVKTWESETSFFTSNISFIQILEYSNGDLLLFGAIASFDTLDIDPGADSLYISGGSGKKYFALRLNTNGEFIWAKQFTLPESIFDDPNLNRVQIDVNDNIFMCGSIDQTFDMDPGSGVNLVTPSSDKDAFIMQLDDELNLQWIYKTEGPGTAYIWTMIQLENGDIIADGSFRDTVDFETGSSKMDKISNGDSDAFAISLTSGGAINWVKTWGGTNRDYEWNYIHEIANGDILLDINSESYKIDADPGPDTFYYYVDTITPIPFRHTINITLDNNGNFISANDTSILGEKMDGDTAYLIGNLFLMGEAIFKYRYSSTDTILSNFLLGSCNGIHFYNFDKELNLHYAGCKSGTFDADPGPDSVSVTANGQDMYVERLNNNGNMDWIAMIREDTSLNLSSIINVDEITTSPRGDIYIAGDFWGAYDFDIGPGEIIETNTKFQRLFLLKLTYRTVGIEENNATSSAKPFPNPSNGQITIDLDRPKGQGTVLIFNQMGQLKSQLQFINQSQLQFELPAEKGLYFIQVNSDEGSEVFKVVRTD